MAAVRTNAAPCASAAVTTFASRQAPRSKSSQIPTASTTPIAACAATTNATGPCVHAVDAAR